MLLLSLIATSCSSGLKVLRRFRLLFHACTCGVDAYVSFTFVEWAGSVILRACNHVPGLLSSFEDLLDGNTFGHLVVLR